MRRIGVIAPCTCPARPGSDSAGRSVFRGVRRGLRGRRCVERPCDQGRRGADRRRRRDDPHVGAALRLPRAGPHAVGVPPLHPGRRRRSGASSPTASAGCPCRPPSRRAREARRADRAPVDLRRARAAACRSSRGAAQAHPDRALAGDRGRGARARGRPVVVGAFQRERHYRAVEHRYRRLAQRADFVLAFADVGAVRRRRRPIEVRSGRRRAGRRMGGHRRRPGLRRLPAGVGAAALAAARGRPGALRGGLDARPARRPAGRARGRPLAGRADPRSATCSGALLAERPLAVESPAPGLTALTNRMVGYLDG